VLLAVLAGCSDDADLDPGSGPSSPASLAPIPTSVPAQSNDEPVITIAPEAAEFTDDPAVSGFRAYASAAVRATRTRGADQTGLSDVVTESELQLLRNDFQAFRENGWLLVGAPEWQVVGVRAVDPSHRQVLTCENDKASYPADEKTGKPIRPATDRWLPKEHWMVLVDGRWKLEHLYEGNYSCDVSS
jgi:hypothetical protein